MHAMLLIYFETHKFTKEYRVISHIFWFRIFKYYIWNSYTYTL